ncbi:hydrolase [Magnaporthiopsis poae ATCC 64411]|uniref:Hydrolase n=1 Tax=Magnaporthiopsis poae (strain ATCC 64411 / 73-15) TaxID=644358 RepID=A0A0C4E8T1_MAGP6|nr:hydrolase [Magnaporthiopsis poae ATCC 64411]
MRIGCLQFAPHVGDLNNNLNRADAVLNRADPRDLEDLDILVLPEMAFTGYNFKSLPEIMPFLEVSGSGISALWARTTALKLDCKVAVGYPEKVDAPTSASSSPKYYNSLLVVNEDGETVANYRKQHLYYTDEPWSQEGTGGFFEGEIEGLGQTAMGICMDINPYKFQAPWHKFEFAFHVLESDANVVIISMAWSTLDSPETFCSRPYEPDMATLEYWAQRMEPLIRAEREDEIILIFANRCGIEADALYAGTSAVLGIQDGEVKVYGVLGRGVKQLLVVDTDDGPFARIVSRPGGATAGEEYEALQEQVGASESLSAPPPPADENPAEGAREGGSEDAGRSSSLAVDVSTNEPSTPTKAPKESHEGSPRADSPILNSARPHLTISTSVTQSPNRIPPAVGSVTSAGTITPPPTGDFPEAFYLEAAREAQLQSPAPNLYTPEEPQWPPREMPEVRPSPPRELPDVDMVDLPVSGDAPAKDDEQALRVPLPEDVPLPAESGSASVLDADEVLTGAPFGPAKGEEEFPLILVNRGADGPARRDSGMSETSISIGVDGSKEVLVVQVRDSAAGDGGDPSRQSSPPRVVTVTFSI